MRENGKKSNPACHPEHVQVLNSLTDTLKDELKRGLNLLDNCVNQLAQAKWILINVERTIEDFYTDCPACDKDNRNATKNRSTTPPPVTPSQSKKASVSSAGPKGKKISSSPPPPPPVEKKTPKSSSAAQNKEVKEPKSAKKSKKKEEVPSTPKVRGRGSGSTALATASAIAHVGLSADDFEDSVVKTEPASNSSPKKRAGPLSKTRVVNKEPLDFTYDGASVFVDLDDIGKLLRGQTFFKGSELNKVIALVGGKPVAEPEKPKQTEKSEEKAVKKDTDIRKSKATVDSSESEEEDLETKKKKLEDKQASLKTLSNLKAGAAASPVNPVKPEVKELLKNTIMKFAKKTDLLSKLAKNIPKGSGEASPKPELTKAKDASDDSEGEEKKKRARKDLISSRKAKGSDDDSDNEPLLELKKKKISKSKSSDDDNDDSDSDENTKKAIARRKKAKKANSSDDSDPEFTMSSPKKRSTTTAKSTPKSSAKSTDSKFKSPSTVNSSDDSGSSDDESARKRKKPKLDSNSPSPRRESPKKSPVRKNSTENKSTVRLSNRDDSPASRSSKTNRKTKDSDDEGSVRSSVKSVPSVTTTTTVTNKPRLSRPGPKSAKMRQEKEREAQKLQEQKKDDDDSAEESKMDIDEDEKGKAETDKKNAIVNKMFSDSDSDDSDVAKIKQKIPLDLQDATRSPSPGATPKDLFGKLLSAYKPDSTENSSSSKLQALKQGGKRIEGKVYEVNQGIQKKLQKRKGKELVPYAGSVINSEDTFTSGKYYIVGQTNKEKLIFCDDDCELQELKLDDDDLEELLE